MAKNHLSEEDFMRQMTGRSQSAPASTSKPTMKLNRPPSGPKISTDELYEQGEKEQEDLKAPATVLADSLLYSLPTVGMVRKVPLNLIDDSPYQPRMFYDPVKLDALGASLRAGGQAEPITLRVMGDRFQLLGGHRRTRAARNIGWNEIDAHIKECDDNQAEQIALLQNEGREDLSEYERGKLYRRALDRSFAKNQTELAALFGCHQSTVSNCMKLLTLPDEIKGFLEKTPDLFGTALAKVIFDLLKDHPNEILLMAEAIQRIADGAETASLRPWFMMKIASRNRTPKKKEAAIVTGKSGKTLFTAKADGGKIQVTLGQGLKVDEQTVMKWLIAALRERAEQAADE